ncbi:hypothetical protein V8C42DRAFT_318923 [Trichoderma barbatum]
MGREIYVLALVVTPSATMIGSAVGFSGTALLLKSKRLWRDPRPRANHFNNQPTVKNAAFSLLAHEYSTQYEHFASTKHKPDDVANANEYFSLEAIHNNVHNYIGGNNVAAGCGHMSSVLWALQAVPTAGSWRRPASSHKLRAYRRAPRALKRLCHTSDRSCVESRCSTLGRRSLAGCYRTCPLRCYLGELSEAWFGGTA